MLEIDRDAIARRLALDNPWWDDDSGDDPTADWPRRAYYAPLAELVRQAVQRAIVLLGARRVGKTTLLRQLIREATQKRDLGPVLYASVDAPTYSGMGLDDLVRLFEEVWALEVKWSDGAQSSESEWAPLMEFARQNAVDRVFMTSRTVSASSERAGVRRIVVPLAALAYEIGRLAASQELLRDRYGLPLADG